MVRLLLIVSIVVGNSVAAFGQTAELGLFHIKRNKNSNEVHYKGRTTRCRWQSSDPLRVHWLRLEDGSGREQDLNYIERSQAYGVAIHRVSSSELRFNVVSLPEVEMVATLSEETGRCVATTRVSVQGRSFVLLAVYVHATEGLLIPTVNYLTFYGCQGGVPALERVVKASLSKDERDQAEATEKKRIGARSRCAPMLR